jgi:hypothetical protein
MLGKYDILDVEFPLGAAASRLQGPTFERCDETATISTPDLFTYLPLIQK